jgi:very-short-patch-repair endonuclease
MIDLDAIKAHYRAAMPQLMEVPDGWGIDPYAWNKLGIRLTPIEKALWNEIRLLDLVVYPQFPVSGYFVDFGNPAVRVAIECDGERWHTDKARDAARQAHIEAKGWTVYRVTGKDCFAPREQPDEHTGAAIPQKSKGRELLELVAARHPIQRRGTQ